RIVTSGVAAIGNTQIAAYPNPTTGTVHFTTGIVTGYSYTLYNLQGQAITQQTIGQPVFTIDMSNYPGGLYTLVLHTATGTIPVRLVRE
ncbi:MAG TPA: T9SS type A sorting domain-containing protein, partial [Chitinophagales bacterium]|nr:T9SS type A sorting domain-containing protein [Chitinophagales bacterium]